MTGSSPVIIFMVVVFPQPFEPRKPKISPRPMLKAHVVDGDEIAEAACKPLRLDRRRLSSGLGARARTMTS